MNQTVEINQALAELLDYKFLKKASENIIVACKIISDNNTTPTATLHNVLPNNNKAFLFTNSLLPKNSSQQYAKSFTISTSRKENTQYVLGWIRNMICDKKYIEYQALTQNFVAIFNIYRYADFIFIQKLIKNMLPARESLGLSEILLNVIEHDVFKDYETTKPTKFRSGTWLTNMENHITINPIKLLIKIEQTKSTFTICHSGEGFDRDSQIKDANSLTGRGIDLCSNFYFETLDFFDHACQIVATSYHT